jgi:hypothetical protein
VGGAQGALLLQLLELLQLGVGVESWAAGAAHTFSSSAVCCELDSLVSAAAVAPTPASGAAGAEVLRWVVGSGMSDRTCAREHGVH